MPQAPSPKAPKPHGLVALAANWCERQRRHRHDPSAVEVRNLGSPCSRPPARPLPVHSQVHPHSLSWPSSSSPLSQSLVTLTLAEATRRGHFYCLLAGGGAGRRLCHLASSPPPPSLSPYGRHCRGTSNEASTPSPGHLWCGCCESSLHVLTAIPHQLPTTASQPSPAQAHVAIMTARPHFAEIQISQNPTGWAPQRSLAPRTCRAPLPACLSPSPSPLCGALAAPQSCRGSRYYRTAERPWPLAKFSRHLPSALSALNNHARESDKTVHTMIPTPETWSP